RRHPDQQFEPLRSADPEPATEAQCDELTLTAGEDITEMGQWIKDLAAERGTFADRLAARQSLTVPSEDPTPATSASLSRPGRRPTRTRSCSPPSRRSGRPHRYWNAPSHETPTGKPQIDRRPVHPLSRSEHHGHCRDHGHRTEPRP